MIDDSYWDTHNVLTGYVDFFFHKLGKWIAYSADSLIFFYDASVIVNLWHKK